MTCAHICACNPVCGMVASGQGQIQDCAACVSIQDKVKSVAMPQCVVNEVYMCSFKWALSKHLRTADNINIFHASPQELKGGRMLACN